MKSQGVLPLNLEPALATFRQTNTNTAHRLLVATSARPQDGVTQGITRAAHQGPAPCPRRESPSECERRGRGCRAAEALNAFEGGGKRTPGILPCSKARPGHSPFKCVRARAMKRRERASASLREVEVEAPDA